ncbi:hypothetical protein PHLGIDRAFT_230064 [Phlebiopsis gigantea 11061_1 CR5-6]|uniref:Uncharacterized protein n=1 Tax=Phlebiopsis gigantea (strain 11061_1 CR5-6) TaxID=745531 RepID=A0A0C3PSR4_PHLG1|nr:hypothetical protein PHLGIDRAFT_230064 [Phlebiopsis gigantea 11061_1 CR5-6]
MNSAMGNYATLAVNITRYAQNERAQYIQLIIIPVLFALCSFIGAMVTSAGIDIYSEIFWDPLKLIRWDSRAAAFFASFSFMFATLGTNISANLLSAANDMTVLFPRYINIKRGQVVVAVLAAEWARRPWEILVSAQGLLSFISG